ncbi:aminotransferase class V-fold PLP-dependent enzyme [Paracoccus sp. S-4012]|uniref:pyridoxal-phosphate-dependent aminotransferase family protein n=1 Tax=Paracoccus sp. S-4012 TaxID=2665648 RepID=UPI0012B01426|nr:aminotransferase class V-fold PLP-dependent enzyme [Paracoccus sp. S-4012]MRX49627.1 aminotransferase class V-fold PLP-dependent enzyme [Paracoccus sp. S-4012]
MSFAAGHEVVAIPGPSRTPDAVLAALHRASPDIYGAPLAALNLGLRARLMRLAPGAAGLATYIGNGHAAWEAAIASMFSRGDRALVLATGHFGRGWAAAATAMGVEVEVMDFGNRAPADPQRLADRLREDRGGLIRAVLVTQVDTASSVRNDLAALRTAMGAHPALFAVDAIASLGCEPLGMDAGGIDVLVAASQKGLMAPPGLGYLWLSDRACAMPAGDLATPYWDWRRRLDEGELWHMWGGTPPVQLLYAQDEALRLLLDEEGLDAAFARHEGLAAAVWAAFDAWGEDGGIGLNITDPAARARSVTAAHLPGAARLREWTAAKAGVTLGVGLGAATPEDALRVAHMGHASAHMILGTLGAMEAGMRALGIAHGPGALDAAAAVIAARA